MRLVYCDRCGQEGGERRQNENGVLVKRLTIGPHHGGRAMDLCGDCRKALHDTLDGFLEVATEPAAPVDVLAAVEAERALGRKLGSYIGRWVALKDHDVVADAGSLDGLLALIDGTEVEAVMQVAERPTGGCFFAVAAAEPSA